MSEERTNLIKIPGISARVVVDADYDWWGLGELLAGEGDREQGEISPRLVREPPGAPRGRRTHATPIPRGTIEENRER